MTTLATTNPDHDCDDCVQLAHGHCPNCEAMRQDLEHARTGCDAYRDALEQTKKEFSELASLFGEVRRHLLRDHRWHDQAPGHAHSIPGKWDHDGSECEWCATWSRVEGALSALGVKP